MQTKFMAAIFLAFLLVGNGACKKEKEEEKQVSKTDLLTDGQWRMTVYTLTPPVDIDGDGTPDADGLATFAPCEKDDLFIFKRDGSLDLNEGPTKCHPGDPQSEITTWAFINNETEIVIDGDRASIIELINSKFRIKVGIGTSTGEVTFTKQ